MESKKTLVVLALVALIGIVGGTFAYFTSSTTLNNEFTTGTYATSVTEEFVSPSNWTPGTTTPKQINVTNDGNVTVAARAKITERWLAADGTTVLNGIRDEERIAIVPIGSNWVRATDGYYYYRDELTEGQTTTNFISSVTFNPNFYLEDGVDIECKITLSDGVTTNSCTSLTTGYAGARYSIDVTLETIQYDNKWEYERDGIQIQFISLNSGNYEVNYFVGDNISMVDLLTYYEIPCTGDFNVYQKLSDNGVLSLGTYSALLKQNIIIEADSTYYCFD